MQQREILLGVYSNKAMMTGKAKFLLFLFDIVSFLLHNVIALTLFWINARYLWFRYDILDAFILNILCIIQLFIGPLVMFFLTRKIRFKKVISLIYRTKIKVFVFTNIWFLFFFTMLGIYGNIWEDTTLVFDDCYNYPCYIILYL